MKRMLRRSKVVFLVTFLLVFGLGAQAPATAGDTDLTRAGMCDLIAGKLGLAPYLPEEPIFSDVPLDYWAAGSIYALHKAGLVKGYPDGTFRPEDPTTRVVFAAFTFRAFGVPFHEPPTPTYSDVPPEHWAYGAIESLTHLGIVQGYVDGTFRPDAVISLAEATETLDNMGSISGRVTDAAGNPIAGADVWAEPYGGGGKGYPGTQTKDDGTYTLVGLSGGEYRLHAKAAGWTFQFYPGTMDGDKAKPVTVTPPGDTAGIDFTLEPGGSIAGRVTDAAGNSLSGISVEAQRKEGGGTGATTKPDGTYRIEGVPYGTYRVLSPGNGRWGPGDSNWAQQEYPTSVAVDALAPDVTGVDFALQPGGSISGRVTDAAGNPIAGANVWAEPYDGGKVGGGARTKDDGTYSLVGLPGGEYRVQTKAAGWTFQFYPGTMDGKKAKPVTVTPPGDTAGIDFTLESGGSIAGRVTDAASNPLGGVSVEAQRKEGGGVGGTTKPDGTYRIDSAPYGTYRVLSPGNGRWGPGDGNWAQQEYPPSVAVDATTPDVTGIDFALQPGGSISGRVTDAAGNPIAGANVWAEPYDGGKAGGGAKTKDDGTYTLAGLSSGDFRVGASAEGWGRQYFPGTLDWGRAKPVTVTAPGDTPGINFTLAPGGSISGRVTDAGGNPLGGVTVDARQDDGSGTVGTTTSPDGAYRLDYLPYGTYKVMSPSDGRWGKGDDNWVQQIYATPVAVDAKTPDVTSIDFALALGGSISGRVTDTAGNPIPKVKVMAGLYEGKWGTGTGTNPDGTYTIRGVPDGEYRVQTRATGWALAYYPGTFQWDQAQPVPVTAPGDTSGIDFTLVPGGSISGRVADRSGAPVPGARVRAERQMEDGKWAGINESKAEADGTYRIDHLPAGEYRARAEANDMAALYYPGTPSWKQAQTLTVTPPGDLSGIDFTLEPARSIAGAVYDAATGAPVPGTDLKLILADGTSGIGGGPNYTDTAGQYRIGSLPAGEYKLLARAKGYLEQWHGGDPGGGWEVAAVITLAGEPRDVAGIDFFLVRGGSISGSVFEVDGVTPAGQAWVQAVDPDTGQAVRGSLATAGSYTVSDLPPGVYKVRAGGAGAPEGPDYVTEFFREQTDLTAAEALTVAAGADTGGVDFTLSRRYATAAGDGVSVDDPYSGATVTFETVTAGGETSVNTATEPPAGDPADFRFLGRYYDVVTTAGYSGTITITLTYDEAEIPAGQDEADLRLFHWDDGVGDWVDVTVLPVDTANNRITGAVSSLSWFGIGFAPYTVTWLPPLATQDSAEGPYVARLNRTVPVKFALSEADGTAVTAPVTITVVRDGDQAVVFSAPVAFDPDLSFYQVDVSTRHWTAGDYTVHLSGTGLHDARYALRAVDEPPGQAKRR